MKLLFSTTIVFFLTPLSVFARTLPLFGLDQSPIQTTDGPPVNGTNPLHYCSDPDKNILQIHSVDLSPNPPKPGKPLTIEARGTLRHTVEQGAKVLLQVKYGLIRLINQEADLCDHIQNVDLHCPLKEGEIHLQKTVDIPKEIPPGKYAVLADVYTEDKQKITCLRADDIIF
jgi:hypothetical protein